MKKSTLGMFIAIVAVVGLVAGFVGERIADMTLDQNVPVQDAAVAPLVHIAFLTGSPAFPTVQGTAAFEGKKNVGTLKLSVTGAAALAGTTLNIFVAGTMVGTVAIDKVGNATLTATFPTAAGVVFPAADPLTPVMLKTAAGDLVASGAF